MSKYSKLQKSNMWEPLKDNTMFTLGQIKKYREVIPLVAIGLSAVAGIFFMTYHRTFVTTIDVQLESCPRWEIPSSPRFFDLRNPRNLKLMNTHDWKPAIHLDNRYRLMRHEAMLDADGNVTDVIGEDDTAGLEFQE